MAGKDGRSPRLKLRTEPAGESTTISRQSNRSGLGSFSRIAPLFDIMSKQPRKPHNHATHVFHSLLVSLCSPVAMLQLTVFPVYQFPNIITSFQSYHWSSHFSIHFACTGGSSLSVSLRVTDKAVSKRALFACEPASSDRKSIRANADDFSPSTLLSGLADSALMLSTHLVKGTIFNAFSFCPSLDRTVGSKSVSHSALRGLTQCRNCALSLGMGR